MNPDDAAENLESADAPPPPRSDPAESGTWGPDHNPTQTESFNDPAETVLIEGEKGSGKTVVGGDIIVRHAYENDNALVQILTSSIRTGAEGIWHDLDTLVLPRWRDGNRYPPFIRHPDGTLTDHPKAGEFMVTASAAFKGVKFGEDRQLLVCESVDREMADVRAKPDLMAKISEVSHGKVFSTRPPQPPSA